MRRSRLLIACMMVLAVSLHSLAMPLPLRLRVAGDERHGFTVNVYRGYDLMITRSEEFSIQLFNTDLSTTATIDGWKGSKWSGNDSAILLSGSTYVSAFDAELEVSVQYVIVSPAIVKKTVRLYQPSMPGMLYILRETSRPPADPQSYTSFEHETFPGGLVHEMFPAVGWVTPAHDLVAFLTDAGYRNQYTRTTRRRFSGRGGGFTGMRRLPDPELFAVASPLEQSQHDHYIRETYGEMYNLDAGRTTIRKLADPQPEGKVRLTRAGDSLLTLQCEGGNRSGVRFIAPMTGQHVYTISFQCQGTAPLALKLLRVRSGSAPVELEDGLKYIDAFPVQADGLTLFKGSIFLPYIGHDTIFLFIGNTSGKAGMLQIRRLTIEEHDPEREPYNVLEIGKAAEKTSYAFIGPWQDHRQFMIDAQQRLAEAKSFRGSAIEKMLYANFNMLTWVTSVTDTTPFNVPNMNYMPDMYNRDCFFAAVSTYNRELNLSLWNQWAATQTPTGAIGTIITPYMGSVEAKDNEASIEWLIWAMLNKRRFGIRLPQEKIRKTVNYVLNSFDSAGDGICRAHFPLCQIDIIDFPRKTDRLAVNQGMLAIALRTIRELGFEIPDGRIQRAEQAYRAFYDPQRKHLLYDRQFPDLLSLTDLEPEFFSIWLFGQAILTDEMVINHLEQVPHFNPSPRAPHPLLGTTAPILIRLIGKKPGYAFLSKAYQPFGQFGTDNYSDGKNDGFYYNGGSWFRAEYCADVVGLKHGWKKARDLMDNRVWAEIYLNPDWPFSKEFIPTKYDSFDDWWPSTKGLCWNVFLLMADEVAGIRDPTMDPDYLSLPINRSHNN